MIRITGASKIPGFIRDLDRAMLELDMALTLKFETWTRRIYMDIVYATPQWSGDLAANWTYSINSIDTNYQPIANKVENSKFWSKADVYSRGEEPAVTIALRNLQGKHPTWRDVVYIHNPTPIAEKVENQTVLIRPINLVDGRVAMVQYHVDKFNRGELRP
jgi:hypothetical protein